MQKTYTYIGVVLVALLLSAVAFVYMHNTEVKEELTTLQNCDDYSSARYLRAVSLYEPMRLRHMQLFNVDTVVAQDTATPFGDCGEKESATRFLIREANDTDLRHYVGYAVAGDTDESFTFYECRGTRECTSSAWCKAPQFGPSSCTGDECSGDTGFRGCGEAPQ